MIIKTPWFKRVLPFAVYMLFILISDLCKTVLPENIADVWLIPIIYPVKIIAVAIVLIIYWKSYEELSITVLKAGHIIAALAAGVLVFVLWIHMDWNFATMGAPDSYDPNVLPLKWFYAFIIIRIFGASVIVPVFEEIFWRSFIIRYIINPDFLLVKIGTFTWVSFLFSSLLFGLEHHFWLAGIAAGIIYNIILYRTRDIWYCIVAHGITNFLLGIYVIKTGNWHFW